MSNAAAINELNKISFDAIGLIARADANLKHNEAKLNEEIKTQQSPMGKNNLKIAGPLVVALVVLGIGLAVRHLAFDSVPVIIEREIILAVSTVLVALGACFFLFKNPSSDRTGGVLCAVVALIGILAAFADVIEENSK